MQWDKITDIILITAFITLGVFAGLGLYQLVTRKSLKKVDRCLLAMFIPLVLMAIVYIVFDKFIVINTRPNGSGESSFPSTHVMVVATIFFCTMLALPKYVKNRYIRICLDILMLAFISLTTTGRVLANMHWLSDVLAGLAFAFIFATIYNFIKKEKHA